jgi:CRISPR-associated protein Csb1
MTVNFDELLAPHGPVALTIRQPLVPALGEGAVVFPPTFAPAEGSAEAPNYLIDPIGDGNFIALIDSVGSQANRMEPIFQKPPYSKLVPQVTVEIGSRKLDLLEAGHRAADAIVRFSDKAEVFQKAFEAIRDSGDSTRLAKIAPTSIVFGVWDSRLTQVKLPRLVEATVRAYGVQRITRSAQFFAALSKDELAGISDNQKQLSKEGLDDAPSGRLPGGVVAGKGIERQAILNLVALRALSASGETAANQLQRYILGLSLIAFLAPAPLYLRQGCLLVEKGNAAAEAVYRDNQRAPFAVSLAEATKFAQSEAAAFGVGEGFTARFEPGKAKESIAKNAKKKGS